MSVLVWPFFLFVFADKACPTYTIFVPKSCYPLISFCALLTGIIFNALSNGCQLRAPPGHPREKIAKPTITPGNGEFAYSISAATPSGLARSPPSKTILSRPSLHSL